MNNKYNKFLFDISEAIDKIDIYVGTPKLFEKYDSDSFLQDAVERNLEIIGEAMKNLLEIHP